MFSLATRALPHRFQLILSSLLASDSLPFLEVLSQEQIQAVCERHEMPAGEETVYTPAVTLWGFLSQVLHHGPQRSCLAAVERIKIMLAHFGRTCCDGNSGPYCRARAKLPLGVVQDLAREVADAGEKCADEDWLWYGRPVDVFDGTTASMPDTEENQEEYPQQSVQKPGLGFPIARMVVVFSLATGMLRNMVVGPYQGKETGETALLRRLMTCLRRNSIVLADKLYSNFWTIAALVGQQVDIVTLHKASSQLDLSKAKRLGKDEYEITWERPDQPAWMDKATYAEMPRTLTLRILRAQIPQKGFRVKTLYIVTTLVDQNVYPHDAVVALYRQRWNAELNIRSVKTALGMDDLRCRTPEMVEKEIWTCMLAYNLIRGKLLQAAKEYGRRPLALSFTFGLQTMAAHWGCAVLMSPEVRAALDLANRRAMAKRRVGNRPDRVEPRAIKRRPKPHRLLNMTRAAARKLLLAGVELYKKQR